MTKALAIVFLAAAAGSVPASAQFFCSNSQLQGNYAFTITGQILGGPQAGGVAGVAMTNFDGQGNLSQVDHVMHNGVAPTTAWRPATGTYTVNSDCTGSGQINFTDGSPSLQLYFVLANLGEEIHIVVNNAGTNITSLGVRRY